MAAILSRPQCVKEDHAGRHSHFFLNKSTLNGTWVIFILFSTYLNVYSEDAVRSGTVSVQRMRWDGPVGFSLKQQSKDHYADIDDQSKTAVTSVH